jgi:predicted site-specific integrase-resolvase
MKVSEYAKQQGVRYETGWRWFRDGKIKGRRIGAHTILVEEETNAAPPPLQKVVIYAPASSAENKSNLDNQAERLLAYCSAKGYQVAKVGKRNWLWRE